MKTINLYFILFLAIVFSACEDELEPKIDNTYGNEDTWRLPEKAEGVLMNAYANIHNQFDGYDNNFLDVATDNAVTNDFNSALYRLGSGALSPQSNPLGIWQKAYGQFKNIHLFMENGLGDNITYVLTDPEADSLNKARLKGEAYFLRAWWGFRLLQHYGGRTNDGQVLGYPIITKTLKDEESADPELFKRDTYEACVAQISADCDSAAYYLPATYTGGDPVVGAVHLGRATEQAALALKSRLYTYAASPAYQPEGVIQINGMGSFNVVNSGDYLAKWERAALVSNNLINELGGFNSLKAKNFNAANTPNEFIWRSYHNNRSLESRNFPPLYYGKGVTGPSQNLVEAFPMQNGYPIDDPRSNYNPQDPYEGRDPRLDLNVLHNGSLLGGEPVETFIGGKDAMGSHPKATRTGYYLRKWLSTSEDMLDPENPKNDHHYHVLLRKTEVYLNFAEASNEAWGPTTKGAGCTYSAVEVISAIRNAAGINSDDYLNEVAALGKNAFRSLIQNERRLELAFENHRFFDMRRSLLDLGVTIKGMSITKEDDGTMLYEPFEVEERQLSDIRYYYLPLPYEEVVKTGMQQNMGW